MAHAAPGDGSPPQRLPPRTPPRRPPQLCFHGYTVDDAVRIERTRDLDVAQVSCGSAASWDLASAAIGM
eukprot:3343201-Pyramimonas_sp.AAC.1